MFLQTDKSWRDYRALNRKWSYQRWRAVQLLRDQTNKDCNMTGTDRNRSLFKAGDGWDDQMVSTCKYRLQLTNKFVFIVE